MPSRMLLEGACRSACLSDPVTVPTHDIAADGGLGWRQLIKRRAQGVQRCPKGPVSFVTSVMAAGAVRRVWEEVVVGWRGRRHRPVTVASAPLTAACLCARTMVV